MSERKTVYFLGAGASNASEFELPVMKGFFDHGRFFSPSFAALHKVIDVNFPATPLEELSLEDVITHLELSIDRFGSFGRRPEGLLYDARKQFDQFVRKRLDYERGRASICCSKFRRVFEDLKKGDTIITLNYDLIIENTLNTISKEKNGRDQHPLYNEVVNLLVESIIYDVAVLRRDLKSGLYLKLHGSIDWYHCPNDHCRNHQMITIPEKAKRDGPHICNGCGSSLEMTIVPPTMGKAFENYPMLGVLWRLARDELATADSVVFIGISFQPSDYYLSRLIKSSFLPEGVREKSIVVVDKCTSVRDRIEEMIATKSERYYDDVEKYIRAEGRRRR